MKKKKLTDTELMNFFHYHGIWKDETRHRIKFHFTDDEEINKALRLVFGYFHRSMVACTVMKKVHPTLEIYASCLSENFAHGALIKARENRIIPPYSEKNAQKYQIGEGRSYAYHG